jgi:hypothetical protein
VSLEEAQAEFSELGRRTAAEHPTAYARLRPVVLPYTYEHLEVNNAFRLWFLRAAQMFVCLLSFVVAVNLAILVYARTVTRVGEIAVRTALGASRQRILLQLFIEALALAVVGVGAGLLLSHAALIRLQSLVPVTRSRRPTLRGSSTGSSNWSRASRPSRALPRSPSRQACPGLRPDGCFGSSIRVHPSWTSARGIAGTTSV